LTDHPRSTGPDAGKAKYMMPVSPWFYTNMPGFTKNWMWNGYDLWHDRWQQVLNVQPEFVEIISWNDFGEVMEQSIGAKSPDIPVPRIEWLTI
jgi:hypothetical protein